ncbi:expressed unknown protein [Seminavis robusta]|uniref:SCP domain-containing protein n=1 Tax=Seminavis robusta TaxID=568900 RepID=A0A9N8EEU8_9STRA|nr:expressed unknown protein [Seminavis robusta]|eukprot:Sro1078_g238820.1 n/a (234) ;mRNA; f:34055-34756
MFGFLKPKSTIGGKFISFSESTSMMGRKRSRQDSKKKWRTCGSWNNVERVMETLDSTDSTMELSQENLGSSFTSTTVDMGNSSARSHRARNASMSSTSASTTATVEPIVCSDISCSRALINHTRRRWNSTLHALRQSDELDDIAAQHAEAMASEGEVFHSNPTELCESLGGAESMRRLGENVISGSDALDMHMRQLEFVTNYTNMVDARYEEVGIATARAKNGKYFLCILFRG